MLKNKNMQNEIQDLMQIAVERKASDLHVMAQSIPSIRIAGELQFLKDREVTSVEKCQEMIFSLFNEEQKELLINNKEIDFSIQFTDFFRFRVNAYFQQGRLSASFRIIPKKIKTIDELKLPSVCHDFAKLKQGFILVVGPTGHGKSTSIAAVIDEISKTRPCHIVTIEDPIEFVFESNISLISQRELHNDTHSWSNALRAVLREDPDVVLIGEMRDYETIAAALTIAETGHLVFSTLHTNSASQSVDRIVDSFPEGAKNLVRSQLATCLEAIISQRLVPSVLGGRYLAYELMLTNGAIRNAIREGKVQMIDNIIQTSASLGMNSLETSLKNLVRLGAISTETAMLYALHPEEISK